MERKITLEEHQKIIYELLYVLDDFCKENNIRYFLSDGTLLGAIRHQGIIPWDDDADVMMERSEYELFKRLITKRPLNGYKAYCIDNTKDYYYPFIKFGKLGTCLVETDWKCIPKNGIGINIDVFPIDGCPNSFTEAQSYVVNKMDSIFNAIHHWCDLEWNDFVGPKQKLYYFYYWFRKRPFLLRPHLKKIFNQVQEYDLTNSKYFFSFWTFYGSRNLFPKDCIEELIHVPFGDRCLPVPKGYDAILKLEYGDYMTPPPESKRASTHKHDLVAIIE